MTEAVLEKYDISQNVKEYILQTLGTIENKITKDKITEDERDLRYYILEFYRSDLSEKIFGELGLKVSCK